MQANAQGSVSYRFLEVTDSLGKPIADARVESEDCYPPVQTTDQKGQLEKGFPVCRGDSNTTRMKISKTGYYPFEDLSEFSLLLTDLRRRYCKAEYCADKLKIELLKIPQTEAEQKAVGDEQRKRKLFAAVLRGEADEVKKLLRIGVSPNLNTNDLRGIPVPKNVAVVTYAAALADAEIIKILLDAGADIKSKNSLAPDILLLFLEAFSGLERASWRHQTVAEKVNPARYYEAGFDLLIEAGADFHFADREGDTALTLAMYRGRGEIFKKLLALDFTPKEKGEALRRLIVRGSGGETPAPLDYAQMLLKAGADPNYAIGDFNDGCKTLLMTAGNNGKLDFVKLLLANKADINFACKNGRTALISALEEEKPETAKMLLDAGASAKETSGRNKTALMLAAAKDYVEIAKDLIAKGASVNVRYFSENALDLAVENKAGAAMLNLLLDAGAAPNGITDPYCIVPLMYAASNNDLDAIRLLLARRADVNLSCGDNYTPLVSAASSGQPEALKMLLEAGAQATGEPGSLALKYARENLNSNYPEVKSRATEIIKILVAAGAK